MSQQIDPIEAARQRLNPPSSFLNAHEAVLRQDEHVRQQAQRLKAKLAPPGTFNIPPILEERRQQHLVPDGAFRIQPLYDWCVLYQLDRADMEDGETWGDTSIVKTQTAKKVAANESPRALLISAGLGALDTLSSHGICIGDVVFMVRNAPWAIQIDVLGPDRLYARICRDADLAAGEDLMKRLASGELRQASKVNKEGQRIHYYETKDGKPLNPVTPHIPDDL
jgi:hypothetical protein